MINHTINHNVATASNGEILQYQVQHSNISLAFNQTNLNAAVLISFHWSNNGTNKAPLVDNAGDAITLTIPSGATGTVGIMLTNVGGQFLHISVDKQSATVGIITTINSHSV